MHNKRLIAIVTALTLLFTQMGFIIGSAEEPAQATAPLYSESELASFESKREKLFDLGVFPTMDKKPDETISRSEFAGIMEKVMGNHFYPATFSENTYIDVKELTTNANAIVALNKMGLMVGVNGYEFKPDNKVTYAQAVKVLVGGLGYRDLAEVNGGYYQGYLKKAIDLGLLRGGASNYDRDLTFFDAVMLIDAALEAEIPEMNAVSDEYATFTTSEDRNLLSVYHNIYPVKGIMTDNGQTALSGKSMAGKGNATVAGVLLTGIQEKFTGLIGMNVVAYYRNTEPKVLLHAYADEAKNDVLVIDAYDLVKDSPKFTKSNIVYKNAAGVTKNAKVSVYADFIYNGAAYTNFVGDTLKISAGTLTLIDADGDKVYETIVADVFYDYLVKTVDTVTGAFYSNYGEPILFNEYEVFHIYDAEGKEIPLADIKYESLLTVYQSKDFTKLIVHVSNVKTSMVIDSITTEEDGSMYVTTGESTYRVGAFYMDRMNDPASSLKAPVTGGKYDVYINIAGEAAFFLDTQNRAEYAYLLAVGSDSTDKLGGTKKAVRIVNEQGDAVTVKSAKNFTVIDSAGVHENDGNAVVNSADLYNTSGEFVPQLVRIKINSKGEFTQLEYDNQVITEAEAPHGFDETKFHKLYSGSITAYSGYSSKNLGSAGYILDKNSKIFFVETPDSITTTDETKVRVIPYSQFAITSITAALYDADQNWAVGAMVCAPSSTSYDDRTFTVVSSKTVIDEFGEERYQVTGYWKNNVWTFREHFPGVFETAIKEFNNTEGKDAEGNPKPGFNTYTGIKPGDVFAVQFDNEKQEIMKAMMVMSPSRSEEQIRKGFGPYSATEYSITTWGRVIGYPVSGTDGTIGILANNEYYVETITSNSFVTIFDTRTGEITKGDRLKLPVIGNVDKSGNIDIGDGSVMIYGWRQRYHLCDVLVVLK